MDWNFDMAKAPRGRLRLIPTTKGVGTRKVAELSHIIVAGDCGTVTLSRWIDDEKRWEMFTVDHPPVAWMPYTGPEIIVEADGKTRRVVRLPTHPSRAESWFDRTLRRAA